MNARDRAQIVTRLARATARRCGEPSTSLRVERTSLASRLDALDVEQAKARRAGPRQRGADPVTGALTAFGLACARTELIAGLRDQFGKTGTCLSGAKGRTCRSHRGCTAHPAM